MAILNSIQVVQHLKPGGIETLALELDKLNTSTGKRYILSLEGVHHEALSAWPRLQPVANRLIFMNKKPGLRIGLIWQLAQLFRELNINTVHSHHIGPLLYAGAAARLAGVSHLIHTEHDAWYLREVKNRRLQKHLCKLLQPKVIADAKRVALDFASYLKCPPPQVILNGIDSQRFKPGNPVLARAKFNLPYTKCIIGCSGRLVPEKGHKYLIQALPLLPKQTHLVIAGHGSEFVSLNELVTKLGLSQQVTFLGRVDDMVSFYQSLDVFCLPSLNEGMPLAPLEAQACGVPAVVTATGASREALCPISGRIVQRANPQALAGALLETMLNDTPASIPRRFVTQFADIRRTVAAYQALTQTS
ncbi:glycosyltransferase [Motilimonas sp. KMU-193]|uniref:glycosyltransferase n=1 Tax=Motilimonas sp. KMU-193 TaxID=3388668 RepID=UPI00396AFE37